MTASGLAPAVLLDTCALIWLANGDLLSAASLIAIQHARSAQGVFVSTASAWEIGLLSRPKPGRSAAFLPDAKTWFAGFMARPAVKEAPITAAISIDASYLPGTLHADPADRFIIATARHRSLPVVTRDRRIIEYAQAGFVQVIPC